MHIGKTLYAGTLGGLAQIENKRVHARVEGFKLETDDQLGDIAGLRNGRISSELTAAAFELLPSGEIHSFEGEIGKFAVNPNALTSDGERLYAGTLEGARILDLQTHEWKTVKSVLPAETVMSIAGDAKSVYFGTTGGIARIEKSYFTEGENK